MQRASQPVTSTSGKSSDQRPFALVAPSLGAALLLGTAGGFVFATLLTLTLALNLSIGPWWSALAQAHGHLQLYGWAGLFVVGVAFHFLPRLRGTPLALPRLVPWMIGFQVTGLVLHSESASRLSAQGTTIPCVTSLAVRHPPIRNGAKKRSWACERFGISCLLFHSSWHCLSPLLGWRVAVPRWQGHPHRVTQARRSTG